MNNTKASNDNPNSEKNDQVDQEQINKLIIDHLNNVDRVIKESSKQLEDLRQEFIRSVKRDFGFDYNESHLESNRFETLFSEKLKFEKERGRELKYNFKKEFDRELLERRRRSQ